MSEQAVVRTESLGCSPLSRAARNGELPQWYRSAPGDAEQWTHYAREVAASVSGDWFADLRSAIAPKGAALARLSASAGGKGVVITTGQQPGLFGGPLMTLVKAISARALADVLAERTGLPVAPLFWSATDDADFDEAAVVSVAVDGGVKEIRLEQRAPTGTPMSRVSIGEIETQAAMLREACGSAPHRSFLEAALSAFRDGETVGDAYTNLLRTVLEPLEMAVLDASHPEVIRRAAPLLRKAAANGEDIAFAAHRRIDEIAAASYKPQVEEVPGLSMVFLNSNGTKRRLPLREAATLADSRDAFLSATVLLRPVLERTIVPTAAYVAGPGEFAYFAQVSAVAERLGVPTPFVAPRWSATIIEPHVQQILNEFGLSVEDLSDPHAANTRIARLRLSPDTNQAIQALRDDLRSGVERLRRSNNGAVPDRTLEGLQRSIEHRLERTERRFLAAVKRAEVDAMRQLGTARGSLFPHGARQERKLAYIPFLARYGPAILDQMLASARVHARAIIETPVEQASPVASR
jgi:bacillithiol biosynthesis cysteine-adding enzyme BshC